MNILMISALAPVGQILKRGLERLGHTVVLVDNPSVFDDGMKSDYPLRWVLPLKKQFGDDFDIIHVHSPNLKKFFLVYPYRHVPMVCHWHGSDLRIWKKSFPVRHWFMRHAKMNLYSTVDLAWWIHGKKKLLLCPVDTEMFKPAEKKGKGTVLFSGGSQSFKAHRVLHKDMPAYLQKFERADVRPAMGLDTHLISITALECASCGLEVVQFPWMNREWVLKNADMMVIAKKLEEIYNE